MRTKQGKYKSRKAVVDGIVFDSKKEAYRFIELSQLERTGAIRDLQRQVKYELIPSQRANGKVVERPCTYIADFVYTDSNGALRVEDVKGYRKGQAYAMFAIKRKLMLYKYDIRVYEV